MANKELVFLSDVRRAILRFEPEAVYILDGIRRADAVEVMRCRDCKWRCRNPAHKVKHCVLSGMSINDDDYCSFGERRCENEVD